MSTQIPKAFRLSTNIIPQTEISTRDINLFELLQKELSNIPLEPESESIHLHFFNSFIKKTYGLIRVGEDSISDLGDFPLQSSQTLSQRINQLALFFLKMKLDQALIHLSICYLDKWKLFSRKTGLRLDFWNVYLGCLYLAIQFYGDSKLALVDFCVELNLDIEMLIKLQIFLLKDVLNYKLMSATIKTDEAERTRKDMIIKLASVPKTMEI